ncbi:MAG TPA: hypothetical protein VMT98_08990 [Verrucomicrobiae bacterium]|nr:hypothetical protein [Verrucomicrobiae bacterium]
MTAEFLERLRREADAKQQEEATYRQESRRRLQLLESERTRLSRRYNFLKDLANAAGASGAETGIAAQLALAAAETGWSEARTGYEEMREHLRPVAAAIQAAMFLVEGDGEAAGDAVAAFADFEIWYREKFAQEFLDLLGRPAPTFQPLVDF